MRVENTNLKNVLLFDHDVFEDHRGTYEELYNKKNYNDVIRDKRGNEIEFVEDDIAVSFKHVLRGIHGDNRTWKLITCLKGAYYIVVLNYDNTSDDFGKWQSFILSSSNKKQILVPPFHGHGYMVMSDEAIFYYKQSCLYRGIDQQFTIKYNDPRFNIWWPIDNPILSIRDKI